jgi:4a-hydroxytetrahydrobiopterin dehydratase
LADLSLENCTPVTRETEPLSDTQIQSYLEQVPGWNVFEESGIKKLARQYRFNNFLDALAFTNRVGEIAEQQDHHPALLTEWGKVTVTWWTHAAGGLHRNDFVMALKTDGEYSGRG